MIDNAIVFLYLTLLLAIGFVKKSKLGGFKLFSQSGEGTQENKLLLVATIFASSIGGGTTFGIVEKAFSENLAYSYAAVGAIIFDLIIAKYIVPKLIKHRGAETIGDIMFVYYGKVGRYIAGAAAILFSIGLVAAQISVSGRIFEYILNVDYRLGVVISYGIVVIYTTIGGLRSILFANQLQFFAILFSIPVISFFGIYQIGFSKFIASIPTIKYSFVENKNLPELTLSIILGFMVMNLFPTFIQRVLINKNVETTQKAIYTKSFIYSIFLIFVSINGLVAFIKYPKIKVALALPHLIDNIIPTGLQGLVVVGLLAAVMSTADSDLNISSVTLVKDFLKPIFNIKNQKIMLITARILNIFLGSSAIIIALSFEKVLDLVIFVAGFWGPVVLIPMVFALFGIRISKIGFFIASISGALSFMIWENFYAKIFILKGVFVGALTNFTIFIIFLSLEKIISKFIKYCK